MEIEAPKVEAEVEVAEAAVVEKQKNQKGKRVRNSTLFS